MAVRGLLLGLAAAVVAGAFCAVFGAVLCLTHGHPWVFAGWTALRGASAGLVAGVLVGAISGIYHIEAPSAEPDQVASHKAVVETHPRLAAYFWRTAVRQKRL